MKITRLTTFIVPPRWCFLKIETDEGITGWGEPVLEGRAHTVAAAVGELADYLVGKAPRHNEDHWTVLYRGGFYRGGAVHMSALAGIDQALWDIKGKALGVSVSDLLGGQVRDKIRVYSWIGGDRPDVSPRHRSIDFFGMARLRRHLSGRMGARLRKRNQSLRASGTSAGGPLIRSHPAHENRQLPARCRVVRAL